MVPPIGIPVKHSARIRTARLATAAALALTLLVAAPLAGAATSSAPEKPAVDSATAAEAASDAAAEKEAKKAADRRAASSKFEQEPLDRKDFESGDGQASKGSASQPSKGGSVGRMFFGLLVVLGVIFGVNFLLKRWGQSRLQGASGTAGVIDVVATTPLAAGRSLHLVRVGGELVLIGATEQSITQLGAVSGEDFQSVAGDGGKGQFQSMLSGAMVAGQPGVPATLGGAASSKPSLISRLLGNLQMLTAR